MLESKNLLKYLEAKRLSALFSPPKHWLLRESTNKGPIEHNSYDATQ